MQKQDNFLIAGRNRSSLQIMFSHFSELIGASWFVAYTGYAYLYGWSVLAILPGMIIAYLTFAYFVVPKIYKESRQKNFYTQGDFVLSKTNHTSSKMLIDVLTIIIQFSWLLVAIIGGAKIVSFLNILSYEWVLIVISLTVLMYVFYSGFKALVITDTIQSIIMLIILGIIFSQLISIRSIEQVLTQSTEAVSFEFIISFFVYGIFSIFSFAEKYQLTFAAKNVKSAKVGMAMNIMPTTLVVLMVIAMGIIANSLSSEAIDPDVAFVKILTHYLPSGFLTMGVLLLLVSIMSTADTRVFSIASYVAFLSQNTKNRIKHIRVASAVVLIITTVMAYFFRDIVQLSIIAAGLALIPSIAMIYIIFGGTKAYLFALLIFCGSVGLLVGLLTLGAVPEIAIYPLMFSLFGFIVELKPLRKLI